MMQEPVLQLGGTPLLVRPRPGRWDEALGPGHRARIESAVGEVIAELVLFVGDHQNVVADALGKTCNLGLDRK